VRELPLECVCGHGTVVVALVTRGGKTYVLCFERHLNGLAYDAKLEGILIRVRVVTGTAANHLWAVIPGCRVDRICNEGGITLAAVASHTDLSRRAGSIHPCGGFTVIVLRVEDLITLDVFSTPCVTPVAEVVVKA
jgi:hypothetical protein